MIMLGALIVASMVVVTGLVVNYIRIDNEILRRQEEEKKKHPNSWEY